MPNPWHDELGRFAEKGVTRVGATTFTREIKVPTQLALAALAFDALEDAGGERYHAQYQLDKHGAWGEGDLEELEAALAEATLLEEVASKHLDAMIEDLRAGGLTDEAATIALAKEQAARHGVEDIDTLDKISEWVGQETVFVEEFTLAEPPAIEMKVIQLVDTSRPGREPIEGAFRYEAVGEGVSLQTEAGSNVDPDRVEQMLAAAVMAKRAAGFTRDVHIYANGSGSDLASSQGIVDANGWVNAGVPQWVHLDRAFVEGPDPTQANRQAWAGNGYAPWQEMGSEPLVDSRQWTTLHEMGHSAQFSAVYGIKVANFDDPPSAPQQERDSIDLYQRHNRSPYLSAYASTNQREMYAETFAEWVNTGGQTNNPVVLEWASTMGWTAPLAELAVRVPGVGPPAGEILPPEPPNFIMVEFFDPVTGAQTGATVYPEEQLTIASSVAFKNEWHDEQGRFARKGYVRRIRAGVESIRATKATMEKALLAGRAKMATVKQPTDAQIAKNQGDALLAREGLLRPGGEGRGNSTDRARRAKKLAEQFGDGEICPCVDCGAPLAATKEIAEAAGIEYLSQDKLITGPQGGGYRDENLVPVCSKDNQSRGAGEHQFPDPPWGNAAEHARKVQANPEVQAEIARHFIARRNTIVERAIERYPAFTTPPGKIESWDEYWNKHPNALPMDWDGSDIASINIQMSEGLDGGGVHDGHATVVGEHGVLRPAVVVPEVELAFDRLDVDDIGVRVEALDVDELGHAVGRRPRSVRGVDEGAVPAPPLGSHHRSVGNVHGAIVDLAEFRNDWHDERGRFAPKGYSGARLARLGPKVLNDSPYDYEQVNVENRAELEASIDEWAEDVRMQLTELSMEFENAEMVQRVSMQGTLASVIVQVQLEGRDVAYLRRELDVDRMVAYADTLNVDPAYQGQGYGTLLQEGFEDWAAGQGFERMEVMAVRTGTYAWARAGYDWANADDFQSIAESLFTAAGGERPGSARSARLFEMSEGFADAAYTGDITLTSTPWEVSEVLGQAMTDGFPSWRGTKPLWTADVQAQSEGLAAGSATPSRIDMLGAVVAAYDAWWPRFPGAAEGAVDPVAEAAWRELLAEQPVLVPLLAPATETSLTIGQVGASLAHDLIWWSDRQTPQVVPAGASADDHKKSNYGKVVKRRKATAEEERKIRDGKWIAPKDHPKGAKSRKGLKNPSYGQRIVAFANDWHDELGRFAPKGTGRRYSRSILGGSLRSAAALALAELERAQRGEEPLDGLSKMPVHVRGLNLDDALKALRESGKQGKQDADLIEKVRNGEATERALVDEWSEPFVEEFEVAVRPSFDMTTTKETIKWRGELTRYEAVGQGVSLYVDDRYTKDVDPERIAVVLASAIMAKQAGGLSGDLEIDATQVTMPGYTGTSDTNGWTLPDRPGKVYLNREFLVGPDPAVEQRAGWERTGMVKPTNASEAKVDSREWVTMHEVGHLVHNSTTFDLDRSKAPGSDPESKALYRQHKGNATLSNYASKNNMEMYAEVFAEWVNTGGSTNNPVVLDYAATFGWGSSTTTAELAVVEPAPTGSGDVAPSFLLVERFDPETGEKTGGIVYPDSQESLTIDRSVALANPWHDELGRFAEKGFTPDGRPLGERDIRIMAGLYDMLEAGRTGDDATFVRIFDELVESLPPQYGPNGYNSEVDAPIRQALESTYGELGYMVAGARERLEEGVEPDRLARNVVGDKMQRLHDKLGMVADEGFEFTETLDDISHLGWGGEPTAITSYGRPADVRPGEIEAVNATVATLAERYPVPGYVSVDYGGLRGHPVDSFKTAAAVTVGHRSLTIDLANTRDMSAKNGMPSAQDREQLIPTIVHEWGHVVSNYELRAHGGINPNARREEAALPATKAYMERMNTTFEAQKPTLSPYGQQNVLEGYAEAFSEWVLTGGATANPAAQAYAEEFGW